MNQKTIRKDLQNESLPSSKQNLWLKRTKKWVLDVDASRNITKEISDAKNPKKPTSRVVFYYEEI